MGPHGPMWGPWGPMWAHVVESNGALGPWAREAWGGISQKSRFRTSSGSEFKGRMHQSVPIRSMLPSYWSSWPREHQPPEAFAHLNLFGFVSNLHLRPQRAPRAPHGPMGPQGPHAPQGAFLGPLGPQGPHQRHRGTQGKPPEPPGGSGTFLEKPGFWPPGGLLAASRHGAWNLAVWTHNGCLD